MKSDTVVLEARFRVDPILLFQVFAGQYDASASIMEICSICKFNAAIHSDGFTKETKITSFGQTL